jgi:AraC-like DNA-binding protein
MPRDENPPTLRYEEQAPPASLAAHVRCVWRMCGPATMGAAPEPIVPDGCVEIVLNLGDPFRRWAPDGAIETQPRRLVAGPTARAVPIAPTGAVDLIGVRFHPWSAAAFLGVSARELRDCLPALDDVASRLDAALSGAVSAPDRAMRLVLEAVERCARRVRAVDPRLAALVETVAGASAPLSLHGVARAHGLGVRRVQALFAHDVGLSPRQVMRVSRLQRALAVARAEPAATWGGVAARAGYFDHAHLVRECRDIVGCPPSAILGRELALTESLLDVAAGERPVGRAT